MGIAEEAEAFLQAEQAKRLDVIRQLEPFARIRAELEQRMAEVEAGQARAWDEAIASGWTADQLRRLGLDAPATKKAPARRRRSPKSKPQEHTEG